MLIFWRQKLNEINKKQETFQPSLQNDLIFTEREHESKQERI